MCEVHQIRTFPPRSPILSHPMPFCELSSPVLGGRRCWQPLGIEGVTLWHWDLKNLSIESRNRDQFLVRLVPVFQKCKPLSTRTCGTTCARRLRMLCKLLNRQNSFKANYFRNRNYLVIPRATHFNCFWSYYRRPWWMTTSRVDARPRYWLYGGCKGTCSVILPQVFTYESPLNIE